MIVLAAIEHAKLIGPTGSTGATGATGALGAAGKDASVWLGGLFTLLGAAIAALAGYVAQKRLNSVRDKRRAVEFEAKFKAASRLVCSDLDGALRVVASAYQEKLWHPHGHPPTDAWISVGESLALKLDDDDLNVVSVAVRQITDAWGYVGIWGEGPLGTEETEALSDIHRDILKARKLLHPIAYPSLYSPTGGLLKSPSFLNIDGDLHLDE